jgi:hypothetical protein
LTALGFEFGSIDESGSWIDR